MDILKETYLFGRLDIKYSRDEIKNIKLKDLEKFNFPKLNFEKKYKSQELKIYDIGWEWRFYINFCTLLEINACNIIKNNDNIKNLLNLFNSVIKNIGKESLINKFEKINYLQDFEDIDIVVICLIKEFKKCFDSYKDNTFKEKNYKLFIQNFKKLIIEDDCYLIYFYPVDKDKKWNPKWIFTYKEKKKQLLYNDFYIDTFYKNHNLVYTNKINNCIEVLHRRVTFLKKNAKYYYEEIICNYLKVFTERIFKNFPLYFVYCEYKILLDINEVYIPELYNLCKKNDTSWIMSVLPLYLSSYLLGYTIITSDIPSSKNISYYLELFINNEDKFYLEYEKKVNNYLELMTFNIPCANSINEKKYTDQYYNYISEYNIDDIIINFNNGVAHVFTYPEMETLLKNKKNFYNRCKIENLKRVEEILSIKLSMKKLLLLRGMDIKLDKTMKENFLEIKNFFKDEKNKFMQFFEENFVIDTYENFLNITL